MQDKFYIGVDPGESGATVIYDGASILADISHQETEQDYVDQLYTHLHGRDNFAVIEKVASSPEQSPSRAFNFGESFGKLKQVMADLKIKRKYVSPEVWQTFLKCKTKGDKKVTKRKAQELFPEHKITHANADAILIAVYAHESNLTNQIKKLTNEIIDLKSERDLRENEQDKNFSRGVREDTI